MNDNDDNKQNRFMSYFTLASDNYKAIDANITIDLCKDQYRYYLIFKHSNIHTSLSYNWQINGIVFSHSVNRVSAVKRNYTEMLK